MKINIKNIKLLILLMSQFFQKQTMKSVLSILLFTSLLSLSYGTSFVPESVKNDPTNFNCTGLPKKCDCPYPCLEQFENSYYCV